MEDGDRAKRMKNILQKSRSPEEALLIACSQSDGENLSSLIELRQDEYQKVRIEFEKNLRHAEWLQRQLHQSSSTSHYQRWKQHLNKNRDPDGSADIERLLQNTKENYTFDHQDQFYRDEPSKAEMARENAALKKRRVAEVAAAKAATKKKTCTKNLSIGSRTDQQPSMQVQSPESQDNASEINNGDEVAEVDHSDDDSDDHEEVVLPLEPIDSRLFKINLKDQDAVEYSLKNVTSQLRKLESELLSRRRALRFLSTAEELQLWQCENGPHPKCRGCGKAEEDPSSTFVLGLCGHVACGQCLENRRSENPGCVSEDCTSAAGPQHIHVGTSFRSIRQPGGYGAKIDSVILLIQEVAEDDQLLLFVQFQPLLTKICGALDAAQITYHAISDGETAGAATLALDFQRNISETRKKVLILNPSNESAAGL